MQIAENNSIVHFMGLNIISDFIINKSTAVILVKTGIQCNYISKWIEFNNDILRGYAKNGPLLSQG